MTFLPVIEVVFDNKLIKIYRNTMAGQLVDEIRASKYVQEIYKKHKMIFEGQKIVIILWENEKQRMADVWVYGENESVEEGAQVSVYLFKELDRYESPIVTAADGLQVLAEEAKETLSKK